MVAGRWKYSLVLSAVTDDVEAVCHVHDLAKKKEFSLIGDEWERYLSLLVAGLSNPVLLLLHATPGFDP